MCQGFSKFFACDPKLVSKNLSTLKKPYNPPNVKIHRIILYFLTTFCLLDQIHNRFSLILILPTLKKGRDPGLNFINVLRTAFMLVDPKSVKNTVKSYLSFYAFWIYWRKSCK